MDVELAHQIEAAKWEGELISEEEAQVHAQMLDRESAASMGTPVKA